MGPLSKTSKWTFGKKPDLLSVEITRTTQISIAYFMWMSNASGQGSMSEASGVFLSFLGLSWGNCGHGKNKGAGESLCLWTFPLMLLIRSLHWLEEVTWPRRAWRMKKHNFTISGKNTADHTAVGKSLYRKGQNTPFPSHIRYFLWKQKPPLRQRTEITWEEKEIYRKFKSCQRSPTAEKALLWRAKLL